MGLTDRAAAWASMMFYRRAPLLIGGLAVALNVRAVDAISTDRPDFVESADVVRAGGVQLETGLSFELDSKGAVNTRTRSTPTLLRIGLGHDLEARIETDGFMHARTDEAGGLTTTGFADTSIGIKWRRSEGDEQAGTPSTAWLLHVDLDSGSAAFRGSGKRPSIRYVAEWELPKGWGLGVMPGLLRDSDDNGQRYTAGIFAITTSTDLAPGLRGFVELALPRIAQASHGGTQASFDTGLTYALGTEMQVDLAVQRGLNKNTADWGFGLGFSVRF